MDRSVIAITVSDEVRAARDCMASAMNTLTGPYARAYGRCVSDLYYCCYLARGVLKLLGRHGNSREAVELARLAEDFEKLRLETPK